MSFILPYSLKKRDDKTFENPFKEKTEDGQLVESDVMGIDNLLILDGVSMRIIEATKLLLNEWERHILTVDAKDYSVYTGIGGLSLLYWRLAKIQNGERFFQDGFKLAERCVASLKGQRFAFLTGDGGPLAIAAVFAHKMLDIEKRNYYISQLHKIYNSRQVIYQEGDELLYGKVGCLYTLLFLRANIGKEAADENLINLLIKSIIDSGKKLAAEESRKSRRVPPLLFQWHEKTYLAAAHGMAGIIFILLQAAEFLTDEILNDLIRPSLDYMLSFRFLSGNFPSTATTTSDRLVQWCHGAPGFVHCLTAAAKVYKNEAYLKAAERCADVVWDRGLLIKGYGLCHGVAGNGYSFLNLFQLTKNPLYFHRALKFAQFCCDYGRHGCRVADRPFSLYEGMAGTIHYLLDVMNPLEAKFPGYEL